MLRPAGQCGNESRSSSRKRGGPCPSRSLTPAGRRYQRGWRCVGTRPDDWLFPSRSRPGDHLTTRQCARLVGEWVAMIELGPRAYGTHSLRRTKVALIYKKTGNLRARQLLLGHRKLESTVRYLGLEVDDPLCLVPADRNLTVPSYRLADRGRPPSGRCEGPSTRNHRSLTRFPDIRR